MQLPRIYPITDTSISSLTHTEQVKLLLAGGATFIQLREKNDSPRTLFADAAEALRTARAAGARLVINDRVDVALALGADGVHLGQTDIPVNVARRLLGNRAIIGYSTHNINQAREALNLPIDYLAFGPIFDTKSKRNPDLVAGLDALRSVKAIVGRVPLVAIGGIDRTNIGEVLMAGANSAAIISAILSKPAEISENLRDLLDPVGETT
ncbi:MAG TPA: thiamine phosphate synthase [Pyrinomonadaceae bacterium]|nr:thiamine phosphate synthase [Pyrinomonadaceae bacterium]